MPAASQPRSYRAEVTNEAQLVRNCHFIRPAETVTPPAARKAQYDNISIKAVNEYGMWLQDLRDYRIYRV